ncbi:MAG: hypothetical protein UF734_10370 [Clostridium sp.]|nr:hypothetical protein [Clostridium sp.]
MPEYLPFTKADKISSRTRYQLLYISKRILLSALIQLYTAKQKRIHRTLSVQYFVTGIKNSQNAEYCFSVSLTFYHHFRITGSFCAGDGS